MIVMIEKSSAQKMAEAFGKKVEKATTETAQNDPDRICGDIWFNGTEAQRAGFGDGTEGRLRSHKPPEKWWNACIADVSKTKETSALGTPKNCIRRLASGDYVLYDQVGRDVYKSDNKTEVKDAAIQMGIDARDETGEVATENSVKFEVGDEVFNKSKTKKGKVIEIKYNMDYNPINVRWDDGSEYRYTESEIQKATIENSVMVPVSTDLTPEETKDAEAELSKAGIKFEKREGLIYVDDKDKDKAVDVALGLFIGSKEKASKMPEILKGKYKQEDWDNMSDEERDRVVKSAEVMG